MVELTRKQIMAEKRVSQGVLKQYKEFYANLSEDLGNTESLAYGQVYVRGHIIDFSPTNIAHYLKEVDFDEVVRGTQPSGDAKDYSSWYGASFSHSINTKTHWPREQTSARIASPSLPAFSVESSEITTIMDLLNQQLTTLLGIEVVLWFNGIEDLKGLKIKQLVLRGALKSLRDSTV
ncbi:hypothetical protein M9H77_02678 [Catharanthus roseus]|uniref:Uncharacterized protein n=1 Tax=Catharanthus roseus TaxID=4058 RepID=A0ACC0C977_CATRO|nr:hypothetical protein M9H77_02678 [Catharanthus roseus]